MHTPRHRLIRQPLRSGPAYGLTLVELMIAMVLGLLVLGGVIQIFVSGRIAYGEVQRVTALQEASGFMAGFLATELRGARSVALVGNELHIDPPGPAGCDGVRVANNALQCRFVSPSDPTQRLWRPLVGDQHSIAFKSMSTTCMPSPCPSAAASASTHGVALSFTMDAVRPGDSREHSLTLTFALRNNLL